MVLTLKLLTPMARTFLDMISRSSYISLIVSDLPWTWGERSWPSKCRPRMSRDRVQPNPLLWDGEEQVPFRERKRQASGRLIVSAVSYVQFGVLGAHTIEIKIIDADIFECLIKLLFDFGWLM